jgi:hypothetical protein
VQRVATVHANREQQVERQELGNGLRDLEIRAHRDGQRPEREEQDGRAEQVRGEQGEIHGV